MTSLVDKVVKNHSSEASDAEELALHGMVILIMISYCPCAVRIGAVPVRRRIDVVPGDIALISRMVMENLATHSVQEFGG
jgi:hypothetical protein